MPIVVGGLAVELHTLGNYTTADIDLISQSGNVHQVMCELGFNVKGGVYQHDHFDEVVEFLCGPLVGSWDRALRMRFPNGLHLLVLCVEDTILLRLEEFAAWPQSRSECQTQLESLFKLHRNDLDCAYLCKEAERRNILQELEHFLSERL